MNTGQRIICQTGNVYVTCDKCGLSCPECYRKAVWAFFEGARAIDD